MTRVGIAPCWLLYEDPTALRVCQELSETYHVPLHSHLADSRDEFTYAKERYGCTPVEYADRIGYLHPGNFYAHCIQLTKSDFAKLAKNEVGIACCSNSDLILNTGVTKGPECWRILSCSIGIRSSMLAESTTRFTLPYFPGTRVWWTRCLSTAGWSSSADI